MKKTQSNFRMLPIPVLLCAIFLMLFAGDSYSALYTNTIILLAILLMLSQVMAIYREGDRNWIQADLLFLSMFFITHFWIWISLQIDDHKMLTWYAKSSSLVDYTAALSLAGMAAFVCGFNLVSRRVYDDDSLHTGNRGWLKIGYVLFFIGAGLVISYILYFGVEAFKGSYTGSTVGTQGSRNVYLLQSIFLNLGIVIILIVNSNLAKRVPGARIPVIVFGIVLLMYLILGDRSEFVYLAAVFAVTYNRYYRSIPFKYILAGMVVISILMSAVQVARRADDRSLTALTDALFDESEEVSVAAGLDNLGGSGGVTLIAVQSVPEEHDFFYGQLKKMELMGVIPFGRRLFLSEEDLKLPYLNTSEFMTWKILGPNSTYGTGTTLVADLYIDFGPPGVIIGLGLLGYIARVIRDKANATQSFIWSIAFCYFAGLLTILPRYSYLKIIRGLVWPLLLLWVIDKFVRKDKTGHGVLESTKGT